MSGEQNNPLYLSSYYHDPDHPAGVVFIEFLHEDFKKGTLIQDLLTELIEKDEKKSSSYHYEINEKDPDFGERFVNEITNTCAEHKVIARDRGWNDFTSKKALGWVIVELSRDKSQFFNDSFWKI